MPAGELAPDEIHLPGVFVYRILRGERYEKPIENRTVEGARPQGKGSERRGCGSRAASRGSSAPATT